MITGTNNSLNRRSFLRWSAAVGGSSALVGGGLLTTAQVAKSHAEPDATGEVVWSSCTVNCGSRCPLRLVVEDGVVVRVLDDDSGDNSLENRSIRACVRGRSIRQRMYSPYRLKTPLRRKAGTKRGDGEWEEISWEEALDEVAEKINRFRNDPQHGPQSVHVIYGTGTTGGNITRRNPLRNLLAVSGGYLYYQADYSTAQITAAVPYTYGAWVNSNSFEDAQHARLQVMFGNNGHETRMSGGGEVFVSAQIKEKHGLRTIVIDPRYSETAQSLADEWIAIRPGTDAALCAAIAHVLITEGMVDQEFLDKYCVGYDEEHMPEGIPAGNSYKSYVLGEGGVHTQAKTPAWAAPITGIPEATIVRLAREIGHAKPCAITQGWGPQRAANGENASRAIFMLPILTGNVGIPGGGTGAREGSYSIPIKRWSEGTNPNKITIPVFMWTEGVARGREMTATNASIQGADALGTDIKVIIMHASNTLVNQHSDHGRTIELLRDDTKCEFIVAIDTTMNPSTKMADILLPDAMSTEQPDWVPNGSAGELGYAIYAQQAVPPAFDSRPTFWICQELAKRWGVDDNFSQGRSQDEWVETLIEESRAAVPDIPASLDDLKTQGVVRQRNPKGFTVPLDDFRADPDANPLKTESGKIEIFSKKLWEMSKTWTWEFAEPGTEGHRLTALPEYFPTWEGVEEARVNRETPLQLITHHFKGRTHSTYHDSPWLREAHPQSVWINTLDADERGIANGDMVLVENPRGKVRLPAHVTVRIVPGTVSIPQGSWVELDADGVDVGGSGNTLTSWNPSPLAKGNTQHTSLVQVSKA